MKSQLHQSDHDTYAIVWTPCRTLSRRAVFFITFIAAILISLVFIYINVPQVKHVQDLLGKTTPKTIKPSYTLTQNLEKLNKTRQHGNLTRQDLKPYNISQDRNLTEEDLKLFNTLQDRAKSRNNRYYLHDFEYFRMIREEFPHTESATKIGHVTDFAAPSTTLNPKDVLFIVMGSVKYVHKAILLTETWLQWSQGNFFIFADAANASIPLTTLPQLENKPTKNDAQHRQLLGSQWLINNKSDLIKNVKWIVFADDDTWINVPALFSYLQMFDYRMLLSIGYIWDDVWAPDWSFFSGGGGIVFSQTAFILTMPLIYTKQCPFKEWNDLTLMYCEKQSGVTKIHSDRFFYDSIPIIKSFRRLMPVFFVGKVTFHYINNAAIAKRMTCDVAIYWKWSIKGCKNMTRDDMSHLPILRWDSIKKSSNHRNKMFM